VRHIVKNTLPQTPTLGCIYRSCLFLFQEVRI